MGLIFSFFQRSLRTILIICTIILGLLVILLKVYWWSHPTPSVYSTNVPLILVGVAYITLVTLFIYAMEPIESVVQALRKTLTNDPTFATPKHIIGKELQELVLTYNSMISEFRDFKATIENSHGDLQTLVANRTAELVRSNLDLILAKERAETAAKSKSTFLNSMSSSLRTPLNGILIYSDLLSTELSESETNSDTLKKDLAKIQTAAKQLLKDIDKIIDYAQVELGQTTLNLTEINTQDLLNEVKIISEQLSKRNINQCDFHKTLLVPSLIRSDSEKLKYILFSLVDNAHKFTSRGIVQITVDFDKDSLVFIISDTGCGINPEKLKTLFGGLTRSVHKGNATLGLSLTLAKKYIDMLGGGLVVKTEQNQGSIFTLKIPIHPTYASVKSNATVLIVSRSCLSEELLSTLLKQGVWATFVKHNEASSLAQNLRPQLVIFTVERADDWDSLWTLQKMPMLEQSRFIILGGSNNKYFIAEARKILQKPVAKDHLARILASFSVERDKPYILIVEDDRVTALLINRHIESLGWETQICTSAEEALIYLDNHMPPSLVLLDLMLPGMSGQNFAKELANRFIDIPIVVVTGREIISGEDLNLLNTHEVSHITDSEAIMELCRMVRSFSDQKFKPNL